MRLLVIAAFLLLGTIGVCGLCVLWAQMIVTGNGNLTIAWLSVGVIVLLAATFELFASIRKKNSEE
jgi:hypothetical protein